MSKVYAKQLLILGATILGLSGCSVFMAAKQPDYKNVDLFRVGTPRTQLLAEFGNPVSSDTKNGTKCDTFSFTQGYTGGAKAGRAFLHGVADVFTLGLWEVIGTPTEAIFSGDQVGYEACYDKDDRIKYFTLLTQNDGRGPKNVGTATDTNADPGGSALGNVSNQSSSSSAAVQQPSIKIPDQPAVESETQSTVTGTNQQKLQELNGLKKEGLITEKEYQQKKKEILKSM